MSFKFDGEEFKRKAENHLREQLEKRVAAVRCPVHGQQAKITPDGPPSDFKWNITGCCEELKEAVRKAIGGK